jgi:hypothetical protein
MFDIYFLEKDKYKVLGLTTATYMILNINAVSKK